MTKVQKIWLGVFLAMFLVPEILFGLLFGVITFNKNFVSNPDSHQGLTVISLVESCGLLFSTVLIFKLKSNWALNLVKIILVVATLWSLYITYLLYATLNFWR